MPQGVYARLHVSTQGSLGLERLLLLNYSLRIDPAVLHLPLPLVELWIHAVIRLVSAVLVAVIAAAAAAVAVDSLLNSQYGWIQLVLFQLAGTLLYAAKQPGPECSTPAPAPLNSPVGHRHAGITCH